MMDDPRELVKDAVCRMEKPKSEMKAPAVYENKVYYFCSEYRQGNVSGAS